MRVLFQPRRLAMEQGGGDSIALRATIARLQALGVECAISNDPQIDLTPFDLVHLYSLGDPYTSLGYWINARRQNKPWVVTPMYWRHDQWLRACTERASEYPEFSLSELNSDEQARIHRMRALEEELYVSIHRLVLDSAQIAFPMSRMEGDILESDLGVPAERVRVAYVAPEPVYADGRAERFASRYGLENQSFVLFVARIEMRKNTLGLIRAWRDEPERLVLIGGMPNPEYARWCRETAGANVLFLGRQALPEVIDACAAARVHVNPSWWEEAGMSALEAALAGCNIAMTQNGPGREYFGEDCHTCDPADAASIRRAVRAALDAPRNPELAARIRNRFTWEETARVLRDAYDQAISEPRRETTRDAAGELAQLSANLAELWDLKEPGYRALAEQAQAQQAWTQELVEMTKQRARGHPLTWMPRRWASKMPRPWARRLFRT